MQNKTQFFLKKRLKNSKKLITLILTTAILLAFPYKLFAQGNTILPNTSTVECSTDQTIYLINENYSNNQANNILTCAVKTGNIHMWMIPYFIKYLAEFLIGIAGILCVLFIVIGGYQLTLGTLIEEKEKGKKTITYALIGLALVLLSWTIVNIVLFLVTS